MGLPPGRIKLPFAGLEERSDCGGTATQKVEDHRHHRQDQEDVDEKRADVEYEKPTQPQQQQNQT
jgi:hypothetical protein